MSVIYEEKRRITYYDLDCRGRIKMSALLRMVQIAADLNAKELGIGFTDLAPLSMTFILQRFGIHINRMPTYDETVLIRTWPATIERGTFFRKGDMYDASGLKQMEWTSMWVLFDIKVRKILRPSALPVSLTGLGDCGTESTAQKINLPDDWGKPMSAYRHTVRYSEVDTNMHMNNSVYGDLIDNVMNMDTATALDTHCAEVQINFLAETKMGEEIDVVCRREGSMYGVVGKVGERKAFSATVRKA